MEIKSKERKIIYYRDDTSEVVERDLDDFIEFINSDGFINKNDLCAFFGIINATYLENGYPRINSHVAEKEKLINELIENELITRKSTRTFLPNNDLFDEDNYFLICANEVIKSVCKANDNGQKYLCSAANNEKLKDLYHLLVETHVISYSNFINWHNNRFHENATVDSMNKMGVKAFYEYTTGKTFPIKASIKPVRK